LCQHQCECYCQHEIPFGEQTTNKHPFNGPFSRTTQVSRYQKGKTHLDFTEANDSEWQWHQLGHMQVCKLLQTDNHTSTPPLSFLQAGCPSCRPTNSVKALKAFKIPFGDLVKKTLSSSYNKLASQSHALDGPDHIKCKRGMSLIVATKKR